MKVNFQTSVGVATGTSPMCMHACGMIRNMNNIILIGMPASGKSTAGVILAKVLGKGFVDTDLVIQQRENARLCDIIEERGIEGFLECEKEAVLSIKTENSVIATGGSVVYSSDAMNYLSGLGRIIYLKVEKELLFKRLRDIHQRGVVLKDGETPDEMYENRKLLYEKYADNVIDEGKLSIEETVCRITDLIKEAQHGIN